VRIIANPLEFPEGDWPALAAGSFRVFAPAKINLHLEILKKRLDGYHEIETLMVQIGLYDALDFELGDNEEERLTCDRADLSVGEDNLIIKAGRLLKKETGTQQGFRIHLMKRIPWAAGLGGGSADGAAALWGLNHLWKLGLNQKELMSLSAQLGSDVAFFLGSAAAWATGRGEILEPVPALFRCPIVLVKPPMGLSTAEVYKRLKVPEFPHNGSECRQAFKEGDFSKLGSLLFNRLQEPAFEISPTVKRYYEQLQQVPTLGCLLSGSGSCCFALCETHQDARAIAENWSRGLRPDELAAPAQIYVTATLTD
jgi:4-diphosphocytidyl-2-C-methyl-D-erythritol kinase